MHIEKLPPLLPAKTSDKFVVDLLTLGLSQDSGVLAGYSDPIHRFIRGCVPILAV